MYDASVWIPIPVQSRLLIFRKRTVVFVRSSLDRRPVFRLALRAHRVGLQNKTAFLFIFIFARVFTGFEHPVPRTYVHPRGTPYNRRPSLIAARRSAAFHVFICYLLFFLIFFLHRYYQSVPFIIIVIIIVVVVIITVVIVARQLASLAAERTRSR